MGLNYRKSINLGKGIRVNLSKGGPSISFGKSGLRFSLNSKGQASGTLGLPGTGLYYNKRINIISTIKKFFTGRDDREDIKDTKDIKDIKNIEERENTVTNDVNRETPNQNMVNDYIEVLKTSHLSSDDLVDWNDVIDTQDPNTEEGKNVIALAKKVLDGDDDAYLTVVGEMEPFSDLEELGTDFQVGMISDDFMGVSFNIKEDETIPMEMVTILKSGKESVKEMSKTVRTNLIKDYVSSTVIRIARDVFALLPVKKLVVNAEDKRTNPATGNEEEVTLLSVIFDRESFMKINFEKIVPFETIKNYENNMDFKPTKGGFQEVLPLK